MGGDVEAAGPAPAACDAGRPGRRLGAARPFVGAVLAALLAAPFVGLPQAAASPEPGYPGTGDTRRSRDHEQRTAQEVARIEARLAAADARLDQVGAQAARAVEAYNGAVYRLGQTRAAAARAERRYFEAAATARDAQADVAAVAASSYREGGELAQLGLVLGADGPQALLDRTSFLEYVGGRKQGVLQRRQQARRNAGVLRARADAAVAAGWSATQVVRRANQRAVAALAAQRRQRDAIRVQRAGLLTQLATARRMTAALERQHRSGVDEAPRAEPARVAAAAAAVRAAATQRPTGARRPAAVRERRSEARRPAAVRERRSGARRPAAMRGHGDSRATTRRIRDTRSSRAPTVGHSRAARSGAERAIGYALAQLGKPYRWAAAGPDSFDCSGLTMRAWQAGGVSLPHYGVAQYEQAAKIVLSQLRRGDLVFFASDRNDHSTIYHVGLYVGGGQMIEAPYPGANVRISTIYRPSLFGAARP